MTTDVRHTPGPVEADYSKIVTAHFGTIVATCQVAGTEQRRMDARLLAAAYNSYDKRCGDNAVEASEGDLLGEALEALRGCVNAFQILRNLKLIAQPRGMLTEENAALAVLAKVQGAK